MPGERTVADVIAEWEGVEPHHMGMPGSSARRTGESIKLFIAEIRRLEAQHQTDGSVIRALTDADKSWFAKLEAARTRLAAQAEVIDRALEWQAAFSAPPVALGAYLRLTAAQSSLVAALDRLSAIAPGGSDEHSA